MKIALGQINPVIGDFRGNCDKIIAVAAQHRAADIILFPELSVCGYPPMDLLDHETFAMESRAALRSLQRELPEGIAVVVGYIGKSQQSSGKGLLNTAAVIYNGSVIHKQAKSLLPTYDVFDESRYFEPAQSRSVFSFKGKKVGIAICEDVWWETEAQSGQRYPVDPVNELLDQGASIILVPSASPFHAGKFHTRLKLIKNIASGSRVPVVYCNMSGANDNLVFDGNSFVVDKNSSLVVKLGAFCDDSGSFDCDREYSEITYTPTLMEEIQAALELGIRDYLVKTGFTKVHLGLSGGIDSALVAVLAANALGPSRVKAFLMPSEFSSPGSIDDSVQLCDSLGIDYSIIKIKDIYAAFLSALDTEFDGLPFNTAEENIQARIRGTLLMGYSNKFDSLVLTTGNKSELATGYCTLYGDMAGSLAVIGDLLKTEVYELCRYINRDHEIIPPSILNKPPSAELRPDQKDEDSLPPYEVLDSILREYLLENKTIRQIAESGHDTATVNKILSLVARSEYKRRQTPPVLKVSKRAFGTGRRIPVARNIYESKK